MPYGDSIACRTCVSQVEHHLWPDLSILSYQKAAPLVKAICKKHNVPYVQQNVFQ